MSRPLKIALLSYEYPPETGFGGIGSYTWYQARALAKLGQEVHVLCGATKPSSLRQSEHDGVQVFRYHADGLWMRNFRRLNKYRLWWTKSRLENGLSMYRALQELIKKHSYDLVEMPECGAEGLWINHRLDLKTFIKLHSPSQLIMNYYDVRRSDITYCSFLERRAMKGAAFFSSCSRFLAEKGKQLGIEKPIRVIPNGIDITLFDAEETVDIRKKFEIPANRLMILFSGRMENRKGIHLCKEIVPAILERHEVAFVFAGQDLFHYMENTLLPYWKTKQLRGSYHYLGRLDPMLVRSCLRQSDVFLLPSLWENCPYACLEAMAAARPIVSTNQGGMPELIHHGQNGLLAQNEDVASYVSCLEQLIEDSALRDRTGKAARATIEESFTDSHIAKVSTDYYHECLNSDA